MAATVAAAALSLVFWAVAARLYPPETVGGGAAQVAAINLLAGVAQLNLMTILPRLLPVAGRRTPTLLWAGYGAIAVSAAAAGLWAFLSGDLSAFTDLTAGSAMVLVLCIVVFALFAVEDGVLTAFGQARWVPVIKAVVSATKLVLLWALIGTGLASAIVVSWVVPTGLAVVVVSVVVFGRWGRAARNTSPSRLPPPRQLGSFVTAEYLNNLLSSVSVFLPPLLVHAALDPAANAYFNIPWLVVLTAQTVLWSAVLSLVVESGRSPEQLVLHFRRIMQIGVVIVGGGPVVLLLAAPFALGLQGPDYAEYGTPVMRLLALSLPFTGLVILYSTIAVIEQRVWKLVILNGAGAALLTAGTWLLLPLLGIVAVGWAYLAVQCGTAIWLVALLARSSVTAASGSPTRAFIDAVASFRPARYR